MTFDLAVIGGGVVGCALFRRFALGGLKTVLLERAPDILAGASKANSAMLHTGFDAPTGSIEQVCIKAGHAEYLAIRGPLNLPLLESGGLMAAWTAEELARLPAVVAQAHANGVADVREIDAKRRSPTARAAPGARCAGRRLRAARASDRSLVRPSGLCVAGHGAGRRAAAGLSRNRRRLRRQGLAPRHKPGPGRGAYRGERRRPTGRRRRGDRAARARFQIKPRKGQFVVFDKPAARLITACIMPVPSERTKGVMVARTIFGNLLVGPTAEEQEDREHATVDRAALEALIARGQRILPALAGQTVTALYAGRRPATQFKDYQIEALPACNWITAAPGIRSTGLTGALGIALQAAALYRRHFGELREQPAPATPVPNLAEHIWRAATPRPAMARWSAIASW